MDYEALGLRIRNRRKSLKMTQEELASASDVSTSYIGHIERGLKHCSLETLIAICNTLKISPDFLLRDSLGEAPAFQDETLSAKSLDLLNGIVHLLREQDKNEA